MALWLLWPGLDSSLRALSAVPGPAVNTAEQSVVAAAPGAAERVYIGMCTIVAIGCLKHVGFRGGRSVL